MLALLALLPDRVEPHLALPELPPGAETFSPDIHIHTAPIQGSNRLRWEQSVLPRLASKIRADLLHLTGAYPPLVTDTPVVLSPCGFPLPDHTQVGVKERLRRSLAAGGQSHLAALLWPDDLPPEQPSSSPPVVSLPPILHPDFHPALNSNPTGGHVLYHGPGDAAALQAIAAVWSWIAPAIGDSYHLAALGFSDAEQAELNRLIAAEGLDGTVECISIRSPAEVLPFYQNAAALLHPAPLSPWGDPLTHALACGLPVCAWETPQASARLGPAGYLVPLDDARLLAAALVTVIVEESVSEQLRSAALQRSAGWKGEAFREGVIGAYKAASRNPQKIKWTLTT